jgi:hypothetical protein
MISDKKIFMEISIESYVKLSSKLKIEKRGMKLKKIFSSETTEPISTKLC